MVHLKCLLLSFFIGLATVFANDRELSLEQKLLSIRSQYDQEILLLSDVSSNEYKNRKLAIEDKFIKKYIALAKLYQKTNRCISFQIFEEALEINSENIDLRAAMGQREVKDYGWLELDQADKHDSGLRPAGVYGWLEKEEVEKYKVGLFRVNGQWSHLEDIREKDIDHASWLNAWEIQSEHFAIRSNTSFDALYSLLKQLEAFHQHFYDTLGLDMGLKKRSPIIVHYYDSKETFLEHSGIFKAIADKSEGVYISYQRKNKFKKLNFKNKYGISHFYNQGSGPLYSVVFHEITHHLLNKANKDFSSRPHQWVSEGLACYFEWPQNASSNLIIPNDRGGGYQRFIQCQQLLQANKAVPLETFFMMTGDKGFVTPNNYKQAMGLTHFFLNVDDGKYREHFLNYVKVIYNGKAKKGTFKKYFKCNPSDVEKEWVQYMLNFKH